MRKAIMSMLLALSGCGQDPAAPLELCLHDARDGWKEVAVPVNRDMLLSGSFEGSVVGDVLRTSGTEKEVWFRDGQGILSVCVYDSMAQEPCQTWPRGFRFERTEQGWETSKWNPFCLQ